MLGIFAFFAEIPFLLFTINCDYTPHTGAAIVTYSIKIKRKPAAAGFSLAAFQTAPKILYPARGNRLLSVTKAISRCGEYRSDYDFIISNNRSTVKLARPILSAMSTGSRAAAAFVKGGTFMEPLTRGAEAWHVRFPPRVARGRTPPAQGDRAAEGRAGAARGERTRHAQGRARAKQGARRGRDGHNEPRTAEAPHGAGPKRHSQTKHMFCLISARCLILFLCSAQIEQNEAAVLSDWVVRRARAVYPLGITKLLAARQRSTHQRAGAGARVAGRTPRERRLAVCRGLLSGCPAPLSREVLMVRSFGLMSKKTEQHKAAAPQLFRSKYLYREA